MILANIEPTLRPKRYTICADCHYELYSPHHERHHKQWQLKQKIDKTPISMNKPKNTSVLIEVTINGVLYRGVVYPVNNVDDVI